MLKERLFLKFISKMLCPQDTSDICSFSLPLLFPTFPPPMYYLLSHHHQYLKG